MEAITRPKTQLSGRVELELQNESLRTELTALRSLVQQQSQVIDNQRKQLTSLETKYDDNGLDQNKELDIGRIEKMEQLLNESQKTVQSLSEEKQSLIESTSLLNSQLMDFQMELAVLKPLVGSTETKTEINKKNYLEQSNKNYTLNVLADQHISGHIHSLELELSAAHKELSEVRKTVMDVHQRDDRHGQQIRALKDKVKSLESTLEAKTTTEYALLERLEALRNRFKTTLTLNSTLNLAINEMRSNEYNINNNSTLNN